MAAEPKIELKLLPHHQEVVVREKATCCDLHCCGDWGICPREREYDVLDHQGHELLVIKHRRPCCASFCCLHKRGMHLRIYEPKGHHPVAHMRQPWLCCSFCPICSCCRPSMHVSTDEDGVQTLGRVQADFQCCSCLPRFTLFDWKNFEMFKVRKRINCLRACCFCCPCCPARVPFVVKDLDGHAVGSITKKAELRSTYSDANSYAIKFPPTAGAGARLTLIAASLLIDYSMFHEETPDPEQQRMLDS